MVLSLSIYTSDIEFPPCLLVLQTQHALKIKRGYDGSSCKYASGTDPPPCLLVLQTQHTEGPTLVLPL